MPIAVLNVERCQPERCDKGICPARKECPVKALWQEEPYSLPFLSGALCNGCAKCVAACPLRAIQLN